MSVGYCVKHLIFSNNGSSCWCDITTLLELLLSSTTWLYRHLSHNLELFHVNLYASIQFVQWTQGHPEFAFAENINEHIRNATNISIFNYHCSVSDLYAEDFLQPTNSHLLRAFIYLGKLLKSPQDKSISAKQAFLRYLIF